MTPPRLEYDLDADTAERATLAFHAADPVGVGGMRAARRRAIAAAGGWFLAGFLLFVALGVSAGLLAVAGGWFLLVLGFLWATFAGRWRRAVRVQVRRQLADPAGQAALGRRALEATRDRLTVTTPYSRGEFPWRAVVRVRRGPDFLFVVLPGPLPQAVPRSAFPDDHAFERFAEDVTELVRQAGGGA